PLFIEAISARIRELGTVPPDAHWIFTAHSIPESMDKKSDYSGQVRETAGIVAGKFAQKSWHVAFQSRSGRPEDPWIGPDVDEKIAELSSQGARSALIVPVGFVLDHMEILYDLDIKAKKTAEQAGIAFLRAKTAGEHPKFIEMLARMV